MSADSRTRQQPTQPPSRGRSGFNPLTLAIAAASAVAAAIIVSKIWSGGTLWATAMTPVIVTLVKEALERPAQKLDVNVSRLSTVRHADPDALVVEEVEPGEQSDVTVYSARGHKWKIAALTGLLAAVVAIAALTLPELVAGHSIFGSGKRTTIFRGTSQPKTTTQQTQTQTVTETQPTETVTQTVPSDTQTTPTVTETTPATTPTPTSTTPTTPSGGQTTPTTTTPAP